MSLRGNRELCQWGRRRSWERANLGRPGLFSMQTRVLGPPGGPVRQLKGDGTRPSSRLEVIFTIDVETLKIFLINYASSAWFYIRMLGVEPVAQIGAYGQEMACSTEAALRCSLISGFLRET